MKLVKKAHIPKCIGYLENTKRAHLHPYKITLNWVSWTMSKTNLLTKAYIIFTIKKQPENLHSKPTLTSGFDIIQLLKHSYVVLV